LLNPDFEINRLRFELQGTDLSPHEIGDIISAASNEVNDAIMNAIGDAASEAVSHAELLGAEDFINDMDIVQDGYIYIIGTRSGKTDYTRQKVENLPNLLKNAKIAKDGSKYKVIPIKQKISKPKIGTSSFDVMRDQAQMQAEARATLLEDMRTDRSARADAMADQFRARIASSIRSKKNTPDQQGPTVAFRTASDKQDAHGSWVIPEKDMDMTQFLIDLNEKIRDTIATAVMSIVDQYKQEYV
jgi:hypothetical protein